MGKKHKQQAAAPQAASEGFSRVGKRLMVCGLGLLILGFLVLSRADAMGRNWASFLSPFLILGGYALVGLGILYPDPEPPASGSPPAAP